MNHVGFFYGKDERIHVCHKTPEGPLNLYPKFLRLRDCDKRVKALSIDLCDWTRTPMPLQKGRE